ncbi:MAG: cupin domain-containing protein [Pseudomonadota bacterium]
MPKIDIRTAPVTEGSDYPAPHAAEFADRVRRRLGDAVGLKTMGVNMTTLPPGQRSSLRHWHEVEEEMVVVLAGQLTLIEDGGTSTLGPGDAAGFPANSGNAHHFENRGERDAVYLEIGTRPTEDRCHYAEVDLIAHDKDGRTWFTTRDGTPLSDTKERFE